MGKVLISWIATNHDFMKKNLDGEQLLTDTLFNEDGPHFNLYKDFGNDFDIHYLLSQHKENENHDNRLKKFAGVLSDRYKKRVVLMFMDIDDIFSVGTIKGKVEELIKYKLEDVEVEVFMNPGTPAMQIAWYLLGSEMANRKTLSFFRRREKRFIQDGVLPPKELVKFDVSKYPLVTNVRDNYKYGTVKKVKEPFITESIENVYKLANSLASNNSTTVLIEGESGTGKRHLANYIHNKSNRKHQSFVVINCIEFTEDQLEKKLLGYIKEAFLGANKDTKSVFEQSRGGTVVINEVEVLTARLQSILLRIIEEKELYPIGSDRRTVLDIRIIVTSSKNLWQLCNEGKFRRDLYYSITIAELKILPFRGYKQKERKKWIQFFLETSYTKLDKRYLENLSKEVWNFLLGYSFSGNLREVQNVIETFYVFCENEVTLSDIPQWMLRDNSAKSLKLDSIVKEHVKRVVVFCDGNFSEASKILDIDRATVRKYMNKTAAR